MDILYSTEKLCGHDKLPTNELHNAIGKQLTAKYDELIFSALGDYGINRDNLGEHADRIYGVRQHHYDHFFIDGVYGFSVHRFPIVWDDLKYSAIGGLEIEVVPSMIGMKAIEYESLNSSR